MRKTFLILAMSLSVPVMADDPPRDRGPAQRLEALLERVSEEREDLDFSLRSIQAELAGICAELNEPPDTESALNEERFDLAWRQAAEAERLLRARASNAAGSIALSGASDGRAVREVLEEVLNWDGLCAVSQLAPGSYSASCQVHPRGGQPLTQIFEIAITQKGGAITANVRAGITLPESGALEGRSVRFRVFAEEQASIDPAGYITAKYIALPSAEILVDGQRLTAQLNLGPSETARRQFEDLALEARPRRSCQVGAGAAHVPGAWSDPTLDRRLHGPWRRYECEQDSNPLTPPVADSADGEPDVLPPAVSATEAL